MNRRDFLSLGSIAVAGAVLRPRPTISTETDAQIIKDRAIHSLRIYPAIGLARVGGSEKFFLSPEIPGLPPSDEDNYKDGRSLIKKQAQRFRIYAYNKKNQVIKEITSSDASIEWSMHLANSKASWYEFYNPLDNGSLAPGISGKKRNPKIKGNKEREKQLIVDGGEITIKGNNTNMNGGNSLYEAKGVFQNKISVKLGEAKTDDQGRLIVFPGDGISVGTTDKKIESYADNPDWIDDWCDGPIKATVRLNNSGTTMKAEPAWIACAGPDYAPEIQPLITMKDVIYNLNIKNNWEKKPNRPSFRKDIYPILRRLDLMKWVSHSALLRTHWVDLGPLSDEDYLWKLSKNNDQNKKLRQGILSKIRPPVSQRNTTGLNEDDRELKRVPWMLGDGVNYENSPLFMLSVTELQYQNLTDWANGNFIEDYVEGDKEKISSFDDIPLSQQPQALTDAVLETCSGGAFHPGVELTYNLRHPTLYQKFHNPNKEPYRIAIGDRESLIQDLGPELTPEILLGKDLSRSPIGKQMPGDLTRWMGIPWQCDAFSCQAVDLEEDFPTATWWPALLPIDVLPEEFYLKAIDTSLSIEERTLFANQRLRWSRRVEGIGYHANQSYWDGLENMITMWQRMGFVVRKPPAQNSESEEKDSILSEDFFVEVGRGKIDKKSPTDIRNESNA